jgi:two-component system chemotaxis response regulator CheB
VAALSRVFALGASAGGLRALSVVLAALPEGFPAPILVVQHLSPDRPSHMADLLGRRTPLHVKEAQEEDRIRPGWVYVAPPDRHLLACEDGTLSLSLTDRVHHSRPSVDVLLTSVAAAFGSRSVGVVLTGSDGDGAAGIRAIKAAGGVTVAQDEATSKQPSMPRAAAETGDVDHVLALEGIAAALITLLRAGGEFGPTRRLPTTPA